MTNTRMQKYVIIGISMIVVAIIAGPIVYAGGLSLGLKCTDEKGKPCFNPRVDEWYKVADWEVDVCRLWGGPEHVVEGLTTFHEAISQFILTLQAEKTVYPDESKLYKISYYIKPANVESIHYRVELMNDSGSKVLEQDSIATNTQGRGAYKLIYSNSTYNIAKITLEDGRVLAVPVVDSNLNTYANFSCSKCGYKGGNN